jgi:hypothetical protein
MKCLSVRQPWAGLLLRHKDVENRGWSTHYRGWLLIHAGKAFDMGAFDAVMELLGPEDGDRIVKEMRVAPRYVRRGIIGMVYITECSWVRKSRWHVEGNWGWYRTNAIEFFKAVPFKGQLGLFDVPDEKVPEIGQIGRIGHIG